MIVLVKGSAGRASISLWLPFCEARFSTLQPNSILPFHATFPIANNTYGALYALNTSCKRTMHGSSTRGFAVSYPKAYNLENTHTALFTITWSLTGTPFCMDLAVLSRPLHLVRPFARRVPFPPSLGLVVLRHLCPDILSVILGIHCPNSFNPD